MLVPITTYPLFTLTSLDTELQSSARWLWEPVWLLDSTNSELVILGVKPARRMRASALSGCWQCGLGASLISAPLLRAATAKHVRFISACWRCTIDVNKLLFILADTNSSVQYQLNWMPCGGRWWRIVQLCRCESRSYSSRENWRSVGRSAGE